MSSPDQEPTLPTWGGLALYSNRDHTNPCASASANCKRHLKNVRSMPDLQENSMVVVTLFYFLKSLGVLDWTRSLAETRGNLPQPIVVLPFVKAEKSHFQKVLRNQFLSLGLILEECCGKGAISYVNCNDLKFSASLVAEKYLAYLIPAYSQSLGKTKQNKQTISGTSYRGKQRDLFNMATQKNR